MAKSQNALNPFDAPHWSNREWAIFHQGEAAYIAEKSRNEFFDKEARSRYQQYAAGHYSAARSHMGIE